jgi:hypothetical protein
MPDEFSEMALDFAKLCLLQPKSYLAREAARVLVRPDGYNSGPEAFAYMDYTDYDDIGSVRPIVSYWCSLNSVGLTITFTDESYTCLLDQRDLIVESNGSPNLSFELFFACITLANDMKIINPPRASMRISDFIKGQEDKT